MTIVDRRLSPRDNNISNRQRVIKRTKDKLKKDISEKVKEKGIENVEENGEVTVTSDSLHEPKFRHDSRTGQNRQVLPGNVYYQRGDKIQKPSQDEQGGKGSSGSDGGDGEDEFNFKLTKEEFLDLFFDDLELPDLIKKKLNKSKTEETKRAGYTDMGTPATLDVKKSFKNSYGRKIALGRPSKKKIRELEKELEDLRSNNDNGIHNTRINEILKELEKLYNKKKKVAWIDPIDVKYKHYIKQEKPSTQAVMFCLMDVSASMMEREKEIAKVFFILLRLFLEKKYEKVDIRFIRHTHNASEVDENVFFYGKETGGTVVSTGLSKVNEIIDNEYPLDEWNVYCAQVSDGDNFDGDNENCYKILNNQLLSKLQYMTYIELVDPHYADPSSSPKRNLWVTYENVQKNNKNLSMKKVNDKKNVYPVFRELFEKG